MTPAKLSQEELDAVLALKQEKYDTWQWNYGKSPQYDQVCRKRFPGGLLEVHMTVRQGCIQALRIYGDFLGLTPVSELENAMAGCQYREDAIREVLSSVDLSCLGSITGEEFIDTILS